MKMIVFAGLLFYFIYPANAQTEFAPLGAEWYYTYNDLCCPENHFNRVVSEKDTIVEGSVCRVIKQYYDNSNVASEKYIIKQEQGKVYYYYQEKFNLLYNFDAQVNDTIVFTFMYKLSGPESREDTLFSARFRVESIVKNSQNLNVFTTKVLEEDILNFWGILVPPSNYQTYSFSEKIGSNREFMTLFVNYPQTQVHRYRSLRCYSDADFSFVSEDWSVLSLPCNYSIASDIDNPMDESVKIYPNPFNDTAFVEINNGGNIEIIDISGKTVYNSVLYNGINEISATHFQKGIYLVKIQNIYNSIQTFKIIKS